jgi:hypothetical protein
MAKVKTVLKRYGSSHESIIKFGPFSIDLDK